jgi:hypothetical protein
LYDKLRRRPALLSPWRSIIFSALAAIFFAFAFFWSDVYAADFVIRPSISLSQEYDDNIFLTRDNTTGDFVTRAVPSVGIAYKTAIWDLALQDTFYWWFYARQKKGYYSNDANLSSKLTVIEHLLYFDVTDTYSNIVLNPRGPSTTENRNVNKTDTNVFSARPYIKYQIDPVTAVSAGYAYINIWYRSGDGIKRQQHEGFLNIQHAFNPKVKAVVGAEYLADRPEVGEPNNDQTAVYLSIAYDINPKTKFDGTAGYRMFRFSDGPDDNRSYYNAGVIYRLARKGSVELRASQLFSVSPTEGIVETASQRLTASYGEQLSVTGSVYHSRDRYIERDLTNDALGVAGGVTYAPNVRRAYRFSGGYEKDKYLPEDQKRDIYFASAGVDHKLSAKATLSVIYMYYKSSGQTETDNYADNTVRLQLTIEI